MEWIDATIRGISNPTERHKRTTLYNTMFAIAPPFAGLKCFRDGVLGSKKTQLAGYEILAIMRVLVPIVYTTFSGCDGLDGIFRSSHALISMFVIYTLPSHTDETLEEAEAHLMEFFKHRDVFRYYSKLNLLLP